MQGAMRRISINSGQASAGRNGTSKELSHSTRDSPHCTLPDSPRALEIGAVNRRPSHHRPQIAENAFKGKPLLTRNLLATNTRIPYMRAATPLGPGEPRVRIPVKRLLARPLISPNLTAQITRGVYHHSRDTGRRPNVSAPLALQKEYPLSSFNDFGFAAPLLR